MVNNKKITYQLTLSANRQLANPNDKHIKIIQERGQQEERP